MSLINKEYQLLLFSLPFWITEIRLIKKTFTKKRRNTSKAKKSKRKSDWSFERIIIIGVLLVMLSLPAGAQRAGMDITKMLPQEKIYIGNFV